MNQILIIILCSKTSKHWVSTELACNNEACFVTLPRTFNAMNTVKQEISLVPLLGM